MPDPNPSPPKTESIPILPIFLPQSGCPHRCVFCNQHISGGPPVTAASVQALLERLEPKYPAGPLEIAFYGGSFTGLDLDVQHELLFTASTIGARRPGFRIRVSTRPDALSMATCGFLKEHGVTTVELGVQSLNDNTLELLNRNHTSAQVHEAVLALQEVKLDAVLQLMYGLPGEDLPAAINTATIACSLNPVAVRLHPTLILAGTELDRWRCAGIFQPLSLERAVKQGARLLQIFRNANIKVIRVGLQPNELLCDPNLVKGPFHPAFRSLVETELRRWILLRIIKRHRLSEVSLAVSCPPSETSYWYGHGAANRRFLAAQYKIRLAVKPLSQAEPDPKDTIETGKDFQVSLG